MGCGKLDRLLALKYLPSRRRAGGRRLKDDGS